MTGAQIKQDHLLNVLLHINLSRGKETSLSNSESGREAIFLSYIIVKHKCTMILLLFDTTKCFEPIPFMSCKHKQGWLTKNWYSTSVHYLLLTWSMSKGTKYRNYGSTLFKAPSTIYGMYQQWAMSQDHFWSICTYPFSTNVGLNGWLLVPNLVDLVSL